MYAIFKTINDYDQPTCPAVIFDKKPSLKQLKSTFYEEINISLDQLKLLLDGETIYNTRSGKPEPWAYSMFRLEEIKQSEWLW